MPGEKKQLGICYENFTEICERCTKKNNCKNAGKHSKIKGFRENGRVQKKLIIEKKKRGILFVEKIVNVIGKIKFDKNFPVQ